MKIYATTRLRVTAEDHQWVKKVEEKQKSKPDNEPDFPEDFFKGSPSSIASGLKAKSDDYKQAMSRLSFYINRAGKNLDTATLNRLDQAKDALRRLYGIDPNKIKNKSTGPNSTQNKH